MSINKKFPIIPPDLLKALHERFGQPRIRKDASEGDLKWLGGQANVVEFLQTQFEEQQKRNE